MLLVISALLIILIAGQWYIRNEEKSSVDAVYKKIGCIDTKLDIAIEIMNNTNSSLVDLLSSHGMELDDLSKMKTSILTSIKKSSNMIASDISEVNDSVSKHVEAVTQARSDLSTAINGLRETG
jgi:uncharacterized phage infection (PIP) family protein YhgE